MNAKFNKADTTFELLVRNMNNLCDQHIFKTSWYLRDLKSGMSAHRNGNVSVTSASTRKVAILMAALKTVKDGRFRLDQNITIEAKYQDNNSGCFQYFTPGFSITFRDALIMMIIVSDNACTGTIVDMLGLDYINSFCSSIGMRDTVHRHGIPPNDLPRNHNANATNTTTARDVGILLELIVKGTKDEISAGLLGCTTNLCELTIDILSWQNLRDRLPAMLPHGTKVANKTGTGTRDCNDVGIIFRNEEPLYILTVFSESIPANLQDETPYIYAASKLISELSLACYNTIQT